LKDENNNLINEIDYLTANIITKYHSKNKGNDKDIFTRIKLKIDGIIFNEKHPKWNPSYNKLISLFDSKLTDKSKIKKLATLCGWEEVRSSNHIVYKRELSNGKIQTFTCPCTTSVWIPTWVSLKRLEEEKILFELS